MLPTETDCTRTLPPRQGRSAGPLVSILKVKISRSWLLLDLHIVLLEELY
jgi:hypothetical protein